MDSKSKLNKSAINKIIKEYSLASTADIVSFLIANKDAYSFYDLSKIAEHANQLRTENSAYYTDEELLLSISENLPNFDDKESLSIIEPSAGVGNFLPIIFKKYKYKKLKIDVVDIDSDSLKILKTLLSFIELPNNIKINFICSDFCTLKITKKYDLAIGNPPFSKIKKDYIKMLSQHYFVNFDSSNLSSYFYEKCCKISDYVCLVMPKNILNTPEFSKTRTYLSKLHIDTIIDFGEKGFKGVLIETIFLVTNTNNLPGNTLVISLMKNTRLEQKQNYIFDNKLPYWIIYRNDFFDSFFLIYEFNVFDVFRDRQITSNLVNHVGKGIRIIKSRNISDDGQTIIDIKNYDEFISDSKASHLTIYQFLNRDDVYLTPNMTYNTRVMKKPKGVITNGSVAVLIPKKEIKLSKDQLVSYSSSYYREFMQIAHNFQTRTLNVDANSVYFYGIRR